MTDPNAPQPGGWPSGPPQRDESTPPPAPWQPAPAPPPAGPTPFQPPAGGGWATPDAPPPPSQPLFGAPVGPPPDVGNRKATIVVALVVVVALLAAAGGIYAVTNNSDGNTATSAASTTPTTTADRVPTTELAPPTTDRATPTTEPTTPTTSSPPPVSDAEFLALVDELSAYVESIRGEPFKEKVVVTLQGDAEFEAGLLDDFDEGIEDLENLEVLYQALGLISPDVVLADEFRSFLGAGVLGYYDTETNELYVRGANPTPYVQQTIVHELVHAYDDQHFELFRPEYDDRDDEIAVGFSAIVEGNARRVENRWMAEQPREFRAEAQDEERAFGAGIDFDAFPQMLLYQLFASYEFGELFIAEILQRNGERGVDSAFQKPPETSEQVLFADSYFGADVRIEVPAPPADAEVISDGVVGALFWLGLFTTSGSVNQTDAQRAVEGWGGDWAVTWQADDRSCFRADVIGDTDRDTDEFESAAGDWAASQGGISVGRIDGRVRVDTCAGGASGNPNA